MGRAVSGTIPWGRTLTWPQARATHTLSLAAGAEARAGIAGDLALAGLESLEATLTLTPWRDGVEIEGQVRAGATQICGLTLDPFDVAIDESLRLRVVPAGSPNAPGPVDGELIIDLDAEDPPDEASPEGLDVTAYVVEALALALDPHPRKPGAVFEAPQSPAEASPFAALARLSKPSS
jgi:hypothetical protein